MDRRERRSHHLGVVVAVVLVAHVWMVSGSTGHTPGLERHHPPAATATSSLPTAGGCPIGMVACLATEPEPEPLAFVLLLALGVAVVLVPPLPLERHAPRVDGRHPPPCSHARSMVVLRQ